MFMYFPRGSEGKASACNAGDLGSIPGMGRSPGEGNGNPPQCSCLENPMDGEAWWATVHGVTKSRTQLRDFTFKMQPEDFLYIYIYIYKRLQRSKYMNKTLPALVQRETTNLLTNAFGVHANRSKEEI